jgi:hypothetical protein
MIRILRSLLSPAEKLSAITTAEAFFAESKERSDPESAIRFLARRGGEKPRQGGEQPS